VHGQAMGTIDFMPSDLSTFPIIGDETTESFDSIGLDVPIIFLLESHYRKKRQKTATPAIDTTRYFNNLG
jgi:hypothetical protein